MFGFRVWTRSRPRAGWRMATPSNRQGHVLNVRHCPGHTPGRVVFHSPELNRAFVSAMFSLLAPRAYQFPQGDQTLINSIRQRLSSWVTKLCSSRGCGPGEHVRARTQDESVPCADLSASLASVLDCPARD